MTDILIVEDDLDIAENMTLFLEASDFNVTHLEEGTHVVSTVKKHEPAIIILDIMLPGIDGTTCCKQIREFSNVPIVMVTAKVEEIDRLIGLEAGADDYICKPFSGAELVLRIKAILRRTQFSPKKTGLVVDEDTFNLSFNSQQVSLTNFEFSLFHLLSKRPGQIYSREQIITQAYPDCRDIYDRTIDSHVRNIRKKIKSLGIEDTVIDSVYGAGYRFLSPEK